MHPRAEPGRRGLNLRWHCPAGGLPSGTPKQGANPRPAGARRFCSPDFPAVSKFFCPIPPPSPPGKGESKVISCKGLRPLHPRDRIRAARAEPALALPGGGLAQRGTGTGGEARNRRVTCPGGCRLGQMFRCRAACRIFQSRQKRLSRFCNTQNHSHHVCCKTSPGPGTNPGSNQKYIGKVLGGLGASFKKPPTFPRFFVSSFPRLSASISFPCRCAEGCPHRSVRSDWRCRGRRIYRRVWRV